MVSVESTLTQAASAVTDLPHSSAAVNLTSLKAAAANVTSSFFGPLSKEHLVRLPLRLASKIDRTVLHIWYQVILENLGINGLLRAGAQNAAGGAGAQVMADAAAQQGLGQGLADMGPESWAAFFAEAFQASTFKSYWGMLHYLTSRWAFTCFAMVGFVISSAQTRPLLTTAGTDIEPNWRLRGIEATNIPQLDEKTGPPDPTDPPLYHSNSPAPPGNPVPNISRFFLVSTWRQQQVQSARLVHGWRSATYCSLHDPFPINRC